MRSTRSRASSAGILPTVATLLAGAALLCAAGQGSAEVFRFDWPTPALADVTLTAKKAEGDVTSRMRMRFDRIRGTRRYRVSFSDVQVLEVNGKDVSSSAGQRTLSASVTAIAAAMPSLVVGRDGKVRDVVGLKKILDAVINAQPEDPPRVTHERLRMVLFAPEMQRVIRAKAVTDWELWVAIWSGLDIQPGTRSEFTSVTESFGGRIPASGYFAHLGDAPGRPGLVRLRMQLVADGAAFRDVLLQTLTALSVRAGKLRAASATERIEHAERREVVELITDAKTLLPYEVKTGIRVRFKLQGKPQREQRETKHFVFDWRSD